MVAWHLFYGPHFSPFLAKHNTVCPNIVTVPKVGKQSASSYWHIFIRFFSDQQNPNNMIPFQYCVNIFFMMCILHFPSNFPSRITRVTTTVLIAHSPRDGAYLSLWECRERTIYWGGLLLVAGELSDRMQEKYGAVVREDPLWPSSCVVNQLMSTLINW